MLAQIDGNPMKAYFEAERKPDGDWRFGARVTQHDWLMQIAGTRNLRAVE